MIKKIKEIFNDFGIFGILFKDKKIIIIGMIKIISWIREDKLVNGLIFICIKPRYGIKIIKKYISLLIFF